MTIHTAEVDNVEEMMVRPFRVTLSATHRYTGTRFCGRFLILANTEMDDLAIRCWPVKDEAKLRAAIVKEVQKEFDFSGMRDISVDLVETLDGRMFMLGLMTPVE